MWKQDQTKQKSKNAVKLVVIALGILVLVLFLGKFVSIFSLLNKPFSSDLTTNKQYTWDGESVINVVFYPVEPSPEFPLSVVSYHPKEGRTLILNISDDTYTELPKGYGEWKVGSIYRLGEEENPPIGPRLLKLSVSRMLGLPVDGIILLQNKQVGDAQQLVTKLRKNPIAGLLFLNNIKTDLSPSETARFISSLSSVRADKIKVLDMAKSNITESRLLPDSSRVLGINTIKLNTFVRDNMNDDTILENNNSVAIYNATSYPGLAQEAARYVTNLGANVVIVASTQEYQKKTSVFLQESLGSETVDFTLRRLSQVFAPWCLKEKCGTVDPKITSSRAQINIVIGEDFYERMNKRGFE